MVVVVVRREEVSGGWGAEAQDRRAGVGVRLLWGPAQVLVTLQCVATMDTTKRATQGKKRKKKRKIGQGDWMATVVTPGTCRGFNDCNANGTGEGVVT